MGEALLQLMTHAVIIPNEVAGLNEEVQKIEPSAVWRDHDGYLAVNYDRIGLKFMTWKEWLRRKDRGS